MSTEQKTYTTTNTFSPKKVRSQSHYWKKKTLYSSCDEKYRLCPWLYQVNPHYSWDSFPTDIQNLILLKYLTEGERFRLRGVSIFYYCAFYASARENQRRIVALVKMGRRFPNLKTLLVQTSYFDLSNFSCHLLPKVESITAVSGICKVSNLPCFHHSVKTIEFSDV